MKKGVFGLFRILFWKAEGTGLEPATPLLGHQISSVAANHSLTLRNCLCNIILRYLLLAVKGLLRMAGHPMPCPFALRSTNPGHLLARKEIDDPTAAKAAAKLDHADMRRTDAPIWAGPTAAE